MSRLKCECSILHHDAGPTLLCELGEQERDKIMASARIELVAMPHMPSRSTRVVRNEPSKSAENLGQRVWRKLFNNQSVVERDR